MVPVQPIEPIFTVLNYLFLHEESRTIAHCLDLDLVTSGANLQAAEESLNALVLYQISSCYINGNWAQLRFKAPNEYWQKLKSAKPLQTGQLEVEVPPVVLPVTRKVTLPVMRSELQGLAA
jgi:hypothetical protein